MAELADALDLGSNFERSAGSIPVRCTINGSLIFRGVAQVVAHQTGGLGVASSSLVTPTKKGGFSTVFLFALKVP